MFTVYNGFVFCCDWYFEDRCGVRVGVVGRDRWGLWKEGYVYCFKISEIDGGEFFYFRRGY